LAESQQRKPDTISSEMVFYDLHRQLISLTELAERETVIEYFQAPCTSDELIEHVRTILADVWHDRWIKSPKKKKIPKPKSTTVVNGGHTSLYRIIQAAKSN
jgi:hypothetical protein